MQQTRSITEDSSSCLCRKLLDWAGHRAGRWSAEGIWGMKSEGEGMISLARRAEVIEESSSEELCVPAQRAAHSPSHMELSKHKCEQPTNIMQTSLVDYPGRVTLRGGR